jgi:Zn-dependent M28 family amino/carboxypeptidase
MLLGTSRLVQGVNVIGIRPSARPTVWLSAHYDSKGQPISMATRILGAGCAALAVGALVASVIAGWTLIPALALAVLGGAILSQNRVTDRSPGAVDNASALVAVFAILDALPRQAAVGVLFLDAEEFGLVGARALVAERAALLEGAAVINLDGLDDRGRPIAFLHRAGPVVRAVAAELGAIEARWLPVLVDGIVLAAAARECVTIMKGDWGTARVIHTPRDTAERLTLAGVRQVAAAVARALASP